MSAWLWRIAAETRRYPATDLTGAGAARYPGRWNEEAQPVVYCAPSLALAVLETAAHVQDANLPLNRFVVRIKVPDAVWSKRIQYDSAHLPANWAAIPAGQTSVRIGARWLKDGNSALLCVPSVIVPEEQIVLLNPAHQDAAKITAAVQRAFEYNRLFRAFED